MFNLSTVLLSTFYFCNSPDDLSQADSEDIPIKRPKLDVTAKCVICEQVGAEALRRGKTVATLVSALQQRRNDVYRRLSGDLEILANKKYFGTPRVIRATPVSKTFVMLQPLTILLMRFQTNEDQKR